MTGGFSGATKVAIELITAHNHQGFAESLLVLRRKKTTTIDKLAELDKQGIDYEFVSGATHVSTIYELKKICESWQPDILVAHGFPEHLLGRWSGWLAKVPHLIQVEHNSKERYNAIKLYQSRKLSRITDRAVAVSNGVASELAKQQLHCNIQVIPNGIDVIKFSAYGSQSLMDRSKDLIMVARYAKSKDHITLIEALYLLKQKGLMPTLTLIGDGRKSYKQAARQLVQKYDLESQVSFIDYSPSIDQHLLQHKLFVMSSRFEGLNLAVLEAMAAGCLVIGSQAVGVEELIKDNEDGWLFAIGDAATLAKLIENALSNISQYQPMTEKAQQKVKGYYNKARVASDYYQLFQLLINHPPALRNNHEAKRS